MLPNGRGATSRETAHGEVNNGAAANGVPVEDAVRELERILQSPSFRTSKQCQRFLRHVVERTLDGNAESLHERSIGHQLYGRKPDYDPSIDPVVRVRAGEIRKRLAQYYVESGSDSEVRLELPVGSYRARFSLTPANAAPAPERAALVLSRRVWPWIAGLIALATVALAVTLRVGSSREPALEAFWEPVFASQRPIVICSGHPVVYFLSARVHERYRKQHEAKALAVQGPYVIPLRPDELVEGRDIVPVTDQYIGAGDGMVSSRLAGLFARHGKDWQLRYGNDLSFTDLRSAPAVLIGAFSNRWTLSLTERLRFLFEVRGGIKRITDRADARRQWALPDIAPDGKVAHDYAIVSRVFHSDTGEALITAAGITQYGTQATAEFLVNNGLIAAAVKNAPADWRKRNLQVILHTKVVGHTSGLPEIVAVHFW